MFKTIALIFVATTLACNSSKVSKMKNADNRLTSKDNTLTSKEKAEGWQLLFDGNRIGDWHSYGKTSVSNIWNVDNGAIHVDVANKNNWPNEDSRDIVTDQEYDNFHFQVDWKIAKNGNSGLIFYVKEDPAKYKRTYETGPEMQVLDNEGHPDAKIHKHRAGDLYDLIASSKETVKPAGEWNHAEIVSNKGKLQLYLNGTNVVTTTLWDDNWRQMLANSKFKSMPAFGTFKSGRIALQEHGDEVWYKNIKIRKL